MAYISKKECFSIFKPELERLIHPVLGTAGQDRALSSHSAKEGWSLHWREVEHTLPIGGWLSREIKKGINPSMPNLL